MIIQVLLSRNICVIFKQNTDNLRKPFLYDLHDVRNALFLNNNTDDYSCDLHFCVHFFIPVINIFF